jgi:endonuclease III
MNLKTGNNPLNYNNPYQLMIMEILSTRDSDADINNLALNLFKIYLDLQSIANKPFGNFTKQITSVTNYNNKANWIFEIAHTLLKDENIPLTLNNLITLKGIGRKSANVITREMKSPIEGIIIDLHVIELLEELD